MIFFPAKDNDGGGGAGEVVPSPQTLLQERQKTSCSKNSIVVSLSENLSYELYRCTPITKCHMSRLQRVLVTNIHITTLSQLTPGD